MENNAGHGIELAIVKLAELMAGLFGELQAELADDENLHESWTLLWEACEAVGGRSD